MKHEFVVTLSGCTKDADATRIMLQYALEQCSDSNIVVNVDCDTDTCRLSKGELIH